MLPIKSVDRVEVTVLIDNFVDILAASTETARRHPLPPALVGDDIQHLRAEHGYSLLVTVHRDSSSSTLLYDAGLGRDTVLHNLDVLSVRPGDIRAIVLSHGHADHHGGLEGLVRRLGRPGLPFILHPDAWKQRRAVFPTGSEIRLPPPSRANLEAEGVSIIDERGPSLLLDETVLVAGQTERVSGFEKGFAVHQAADNGGWEPDPWIWDDQSVSVVVKDKGLVILSSCSHSGGVNVIRHVQRLTGEKRVHAFIGGFHLTGGLFEPIIPATVDELVKIAPDYVVPGHCTGWRATLEMANRLPGAFVQTSVGTRFVFGA